MRSTDIYKIYEGGLDVGFQGFVLSGKGVANGKHRGEVDKV